MVSANSLSPSYETCSLKRRTNLKNRNEKEKNILSMDLESQRRSMYTNSQKWSNKRPFFKIELVKKGQILKRGFWQMRCQHCQKNEATIRLNMQINYTKKQMDLCENCYKELTQPSMYSGNHFFGGVLSSASLLKRSSKPLPKKACSMNSPSI